MILILFLTIFGWMEDSLQSHSDNFEIQLREGRLGRMDSSLATYHDTVSSRSDRLKSLRVSSRLARLSLQYHLKLEGCEPILNESDMNKFKQYVSFLELQ